MNCNRSGSGPWKFITKTATIEKTQIWTARLGISQRLETYRTLILRDEYKERIWKERGEIRVVTGNLDEFMGALEKVRKVLTEFGDEKAAQ